MTNKKYPVSLEEVKAHLNIIGDVDDLEIEILTACAVDYVSGITGKDLMIPSNVNETLRLAILMAVAFFYENRGDERSSKSEPLAAKYLALQERHSVL